ncbi:MAG: PEP-CTERM sorting domain-containing protein, partial [Desulfobacteraceae bacterium]|nr:PEP-CTERM sorting domain-containing protein [Desulfobacteraceae bacterium]
SLGGFDVEVTYNDTILDFETVWFSNWLGNTSPISFETDIFVGDTIPGELRLQEVSLLPDWELDNLQTVDSMVLAIMTFKGSLPGGTSDLGFGGVDLSDVFGFAFDSIDLVGSSVYVTPEPSTYFLLIIGLGGMMVLQKMRRRIRE